MAESFKTRFTNSFHQRKDIDIILQNTPEPQSPLSLRIPWLFDLIDWIRREGITKHDFDFTSGAPQAARVRFLLQLLDRNSDWKHNVARTLRSIIKDSKGLELFIETGLFAEDHFAGELSARIHKKLLPQVPKENELAFIFGENFRTPADIEWFQLIDTTTFSKILNLFNDSVGPEEEGWNSLKVDCEQAMFLLGLQVQGLGLSREIRNRISVSHFEKLPFHQLPEAIERFITEPSSDQRSLFAEQISSQLGNCKAALREVQNHLDQFGVSIEIVYKIDRLEHLLNRISDLLNLLRSSPVDPEKLSFFITNLISDTIEKRSIKAFLNKSFSLLSRKIVERNAETGEHYITRNKTEYLQMIKSALGGGVVTTFTALFKLGLHFLSSEAFLYGLASSFNYSISFLVIHFSHFTLGTKQPSTTAPALAARMNQIDSPSELTSLGDEIVHIVRSQFAAILGNVIGVGPLMFAICWTYKYLFGSFLMSPADAKHTIESFSILGLTPFYAFFTGILLWASSLFSGWFENWYTYHQISPALAQNRRLHFIFGASTSKAIADFLKNNILGISSSISLGFLLGLTPALFQFFGIHIEVRHVTLSSGAFAAALTSWPDTSGESIQIVEAILGIISMGLINVTVAFTLALFLAVRARQVRAPKRRLLYKEVGRRLFKKPLSFIWPTASA